MHAASLVTALAFTAGSAATSGPRDAAAAAASGQFLQTFAAANARPQAHTREQAVADAMRFDVISATVDMYRDHVSAMRAANASLVMLAYMNCTFAQQI